MRFTKSRKQLRRAQKNTKDPRLTLLKRFFIIFALAIIAKLFVLQVVDAGFYQALASDQHEIFKTLFPERGTVYVHDESSISDDGLYPVATNREYKTVYAQPRFIDDPRAVADALAPILEIEADELMQKLDKPNDPYEVLKRKLNEHTVAQIEALSLEGVKFQTEEWRYYPEKQIGSQVLGFVARRDDHERNGQYGIEGYFDDDLAGSQGEVRSEKDLSGRWISSTARSYTPAVDGDDIVLTIDKTIQYKVCSILNEQAELYQAHSATAIVMDPFTGEIMAMCSYPTFDPNEYNLVEDIRAYNNTAIFEAYEPGSIFKPVTMSAALDMNVVQPDSTYIDTGEVKVDKFTIRNSDLKAHGKVSMVDVLDLSLNTGMIHVVQKLGVSDFKRYVENFGFGQTTGIQLNSEAAGNISSLDKAGPIYSYTASYGQGITATPLQMVQAFSAMANGGYLVKPYVVDEIRHADWTQKTEPAVLRKVLDERTSTLISGMLVSVVRRGHAGSAGVDGYMIAGKTGTAQIPDFERGGYSNKTNHSFVGYGPVDDPAFTMIVKFEDPKVGGFAAGTAAPTFGRIADFLLDYLKIPPSE